MTDSTASASRQRVADLLRARIDSERSDVRLSLQRVNEDKRRLIESAFDMIAALDGVDNGGHLPPSDFPSTVPLYTLLPLPSDPAVALIPPPWTSAVEAGAVPMGLPEVVRLYSVDAEYRVDASESAGREGYWQVRVVVGPGPEAGDLQAVSLSFLPAQAMEVGPYPLPPRLPPSLFPLSPASAVAVRQLESRSTVLAALPAASVATLSASVDVTACVPPGLQSLDVTLLFHYQCAQLPPSKPPSTADSSSASTSPRFVVVTQLQLPRWPAGGGTSINRPQLQLPSALDSRAIIALEPLTSSHRIDLLALPAAAGAAPLPLVAQLLRDRQGMEEVEWQQYTAVVGVTEAMKAAPGGQLFVCPASSGYAAAVCCVLWAEDGSRGHLRVFGAAVSQAAAFIASLQSALSASGVRLAVDVASAAALTAAESCLSSLAREAELAVRRLHISALQRMGPSVPPLRSLTAVCRPVLCPRSCRGRLSWTVLSGSATWPTWPSPTSSPSSRSPRLPPPLPHQVVGLWRAAHKS